MRFNAETTGFYDYVPEYENRPEYNPDQFIEAKKATDEENEKLTAKFKEPLIAKIMLNAKETEVIEQVMSELEDCGTITLTNTDGGYDMIKEVRSFMGEWDFYKFLEYSMQVWGLPQAQSFDDWTEND